MKTYYKVVALLITIIFLFGFDLIPVGYSNIADVMNNAAKLEGKEVKIKGTVTSINKLVGVSAKFFKIKDSTGEIYVITQNHLPVMDEEIAINAVVENTIIVAGKNFGLHLKEIKRF